MVHGIAILTPEDLPLHSSLGSENDVYHTIHIHTVHYVCEHACNQRLTTWTDFLRGKCFWVCVLSSILISNSVHCTGLQQQEEEETVCGCCGQDDSAVGGGEGCCCVGGDGCCCAGWDPTIVVTKLHKVYLISVPYYCMEPDKSWLYLI